MPVMRAVLVIVLDPTRVRKIRGAGWPALPAMLPGVRSARWVNAATAMPSCSRPGNGGSRRLDGWGVVQIAAVLWSGHSVTGLLRLVTERPDHTLYRHSAARGLRKRRPPPTSCQ